MKTPDLFGYEAPASPSPSPSPVKPRRPPVAWREFSFDELLQAVRIGLPGADLAAYRRAASSVDLLDLAEARAEAREARSRR